MADENISFYFGKAEFRQRRDKRIYELWREEMGVMPVHRENGRLELWLYLDNVDEMHANIDLEKVFSEVYDGNGYDPDDAERMIEALRRIANDLESKLGDEPCIP